MFRRYVAASRRRTQQFEDRAQIVRMSLTFGIHGCQGISADRVIHPLSQREPLLRGVFIDWSANAEILHQSQIRRAQSGTFLGGLQKQFLCSGGILRGTDAIEIADSQIYLGQWEPGGGRQLKPMESATGIHPYADSVFVEIGDLN